MNKKVNNCSNNLPRVEVHQSLTGMFNSDGECTKTFEELFEKLQSDGYQGVFWRLPEEKKDKEFSHLLKKYKLNFGVNLICESDIQTKTDYIMRAKDIGAQYVNVQIKDYFLDDSKAIQRIESVNKISEQLKIPIFIETHRGSITQDLIRTLEYVRKIKNINLTVDLSHYVLAGEIGKPSKNFNDAIDSLLRKASCYHGRISNGQQIQSVIEQSNEDIILNYKKWWKAGINYWLQDAKNGDILPFVIELLPPPYGILDTVQSKKQNVYVEMVDRIEQAIILKKIIIDILDELN